jgi:lipid II:glycine glycyltransferase (peptidoglycan interpeptide bridge formation enzyme)
MWGAPDLFDGNDPLAGVFRFKSGFGGQVIRGVGAWDYSSNRLRYWLYHWLLPRLLGLFRLVGRQQTRQLVNDTFQERIGDD